MSKSLWSEVLEGTFNTEGQNDTSYEAEVESVTDDSESMIGYVASCTEGMLAVQAAVATMEGRCAVQYMKGQKEEATATMEGVIRNAYETLKEWVKKAYAAIKKFLKKAWNKMKGYVNVFKAMVTKYNYVLKGKMPTGLKVDWVRIEMQDGLEIYQDMIKIIKGESQATDNNNDYHKALEDAFFPDSTGRAVQEKTLTADILKEAVQVADDGFDKVYSEAFKLGENTERDALKALNEEANTDQNRIDKKKDGTAKDKEQSSLNQRVRRVTNISRTFASMVNTAASLKVRLSVKVCRKVIRAQAQNSSATFGLESSDFSAVMGEIL